MCWYLERQKHIYLSDQFTAASVDEEALQSQVATSCNGSGIIPSISAVPPRQPQAFNPISQTADKTMKRPDPPENVVYTDSVRNGAQPAILRASPMVKEVK